VEESATLIERFAHLDVRQIVTLNALPTPFRRPTLHL
jgi:hypothetical protein